MSAGDSLTELLERAMRNRMAEVQTCMPAQIVSYDYKTQKASVQPVINRRYADGRIEAWPVINNVPVIFPRAGGASLTMPVKAKDTVLLVFASRSIDSWANRGGMVNQDDNRMHNINDAIAIPGLMPFNGGGKAKNNDDVLLTYNGAEVEIKKNGQINLKSATRVTIDAPLCRMTGDLIVKNDIYDQDAQYGSSSNHRQKYNAHTHDENDNNTQTENPRPEYQWNGS